jgi:hypothetical protein
MSWTCPKCDRELPQPEQRHYCARVSLDSLFQSRSAELILIFDKLLAEVADWDGVLVGTTPNCIVYPKAHLPGDQADEKGTGCKVLF